MYLFSTFLRTQKIKNMQIHLYFIDNIESCILRPLDPAGGNFSEPVKLRGGSESTQGQ
jgi:hypothetical protein